MYLTITESNQKEGILTTEDLLNISTKYEDTTGRCIFWYTLLTYLGIIFIFAILHIIDLHTEFSINNTFNRFHGGSMLGYGIMISILAMIPTIITYAVGNKSYKNWHNKYMPGKYLKPASCF